VIVGGAASIALFQLLGRGSLATVTTLSVGLLAAAWATRRAPEYVAEGNGLWLTALVASAAAISLAWEFEPLLPVVLALILACASCVTNTSPWHILRWPAFVISVVLMAISFVQRSGNWWYITDDYAYFEVITNHLTRSGPFADWGLINFTKYHWLSYGWSGLLNHLAGSPETFTTLTRVMPPTYSASFAASSVLIVRMLLGKRIRSWQGAAAVWTIALLNPLDWSGTSTAGVYAVLLAFLVTLGVAIEQRIGLRRRLVVYAILLPIAALTKVPSVFAIGIFALIAELLLHVNLPLKRRGIYIAFAVATAILLTVPFLFLLGWIADFYSVGGFNPNLGQLAQTGTLFSLLVVALQRMPTLTNCLVAIFALFIGSSAKRGYTDRPKMSLLALSFFGIGCCLQVVIVGNANVADYFGGPFFLLASLGVVIGLSQVDSIIVAQQTTRVVRNALLLACGGFVWTQIHLLFWDGLRELSSYPPFALRVELLRFATATSQFGASLLTLLLVGIASLRKRREHSRVPILLLSFTTALVPLYFIMQQPRMMEALTRNGPTAVRLRIEDSDLRAAAKWIDKNTPERSTVATNALYDYDIGGTFDDFLLGAWSEREVIALGPKYFYERFDMTEARAASLLFATAPNEKSFRLLSALGVEWFVVDLSRTDRREWQPFANIVHRSGKYLILRLEGEPKEFSGEE
jgi:hypothetical protein